MNKVLILLIIFCLTFGYTSFASTNKPLENLGQGLDNMFYGKVEIPDNANETGTKGSPAFPDCTVSTNDDFGRGVARFVGGVWQIATFWYPEDSSD